LGSEFGGEGLEVLVGGEVAEEEGAILGGEGGEVRIC
jgi:hypothetical protein